MKDDIFVVLNAYFSQHDILKTMKQTTLLKLLKTFL